MIAWVLPAATLVVVLGLFLVTVLRRADVLPGPRDRALRGDAEALASRIEAIAESLERQAKEARIVATAARKGAPK